MTTTADFAVRDLEEAPKEAPTKEAPTKEAPTKAPTEGPIPPGAGGS